MTAELAPAPKKKRRIRIKFRSRFNPGQVRAWQSEDLWTAYLGGWGAGKTWLGARAFLRNLLRNPKGVDGLIAAPFWATITRTTLRTFLAAVPKGMITGASRGERWVEVLGRRVYYGSADRPETLDGPTVGVAWLDEGRYVSRDGWEVVLSRLRAKRARARRGIVTSTPGGEWLEEEFGSGRTNRCAVHASTRENRHNLGEGYIEDLESSLSKRAARVFIDGEFGFLEGLVYALEKKRHLIPWAHRPDLPVYVAWDFGWQRPAVLFLQPIPAGTVLPPIEGTVVRRVALPGSWVAFDELVLDEISTEVLAQRVKATGYRIRRIYCDPAGDGTQPAIGTSDVKQLRAAGFTDIRWVEEPWIRYIPTGVRVVEAMLENALGETRLFVAKQLDKPDSPTVKRGIVKDFRGYRYPERKGGRPVKEHPLKDGLHDHTMDAIRYFAIGEASAAGTIAESRQVR